MDQKSRLSHFLFFFKIVLNKTTFLFAVQWRHPNSVNECVYFSMHQSCHELLNISYFLYSFFIVAVDFLVTICVLTKLKFIIYFYYDLSLLINFHWSLIPLLISHPFIVYLSSDGRNMWLECPGLEIFLCFYFISRRVSCLLSHGVPLPPHRLS
jgi:hypothetical protein